MKSSADEIWGTSHDMPIIKDLLWEADSNSLISANITLYYEFDRDVSISININIPYSVLNFQRRHLDLIQLI
jgi:hypothetical protein